MGTLERSYYGSCVIGRNEGEFRESFNKHYAQYRKAEEPMESFVQRMRSTRPLIGTASEVTEKIEALKQFGVSYFMLYFPDKEGLGLLHRFTEQVMPHFVNG